MVLATMVKSTRYNVNRYNKMVQANSNSYKHTANNLLHYDET